MNEASEEHTATMQSLLQMSSCSLAEGIKYLGYIINPNGYKARDWQWLIHRFEQRIKHWGWRWLSLGGQLTLAPSVLTDMAVY